MKNQKINENQATITNFYELSAKASIFRVMGKNPGECKAVSEPSQAEKSNGSSKASLDNLMRFKNMFKFGLFTNRVDLK